MQINGLNPLAWRSFPVMSISVSRCQEASIEKSSQCNNDYFKKEAPFQKKTSRNAVLPHHFQLTTSASVTSMTSCFEGEASNNDDSDMNFGPKFFEEHHENNSIMRQNDNIFLN